MEEQLRARNRAPLKQSMPFKPFSLGLALMSVAASLALAAHYPLGPVGMSVVAVVCCVAVFARQELWLMILPALLPVIGLAPWSGWITFEELDILILAVAAGGYARLAWPAPGQHTTHSGNHRHAKSSFVGTWSLAGLFALATMVSINRGFADAGGFSFGWFHGYHEPMNSVRVGKSFFLALLLVPLWQVASKQDPQRAQNLLSLGLMLGLAAAALITLWERLAFTGLLNFSSDYRTTGMFWEMHVGGAALDGFLALTVPFAVRELMVARSTSRWCLAAGVLALAAYACLTTFSRGVYLALPVGLLSYFMLTGGSGSPRFASTNEPGGAQDPRPWLSMLSGLLLVAGFGVGAAWMFQSSGYRGMAALLGTVALMLPLAQVLRGFRASQWMMGLAMGLFLMMVTGTMTWLIPKGVYIAWGLVAAFAATMLWVQRRGNPATSLARPLALGGFLATVACTALVAYFWNESKSLVHATPVLLAVLGITAASVVWRKPLWPDALRWQATTVGAMGLVTAAIGVMLGGTYMTDRFSTGDQDMDTRLAHWQLSSNMLRSPADWWLGKGLGRFPANYSLAGKPEQHPGDYRLKMQDGDAYITLTGGLHTNGWGEIFRVSQRVAEPGASAIVTARVRAEKDVVLHFEVCEKHLLYGQGCVGKDVGVKGTPDVWQDIRVEMKGKGASRGSWYAPRLLVFSMAMDSRGGLADLDNVVLSRADGQQLLSNSGFSNGMAHWFFSSDRNHMPWHTKSMFMHVLFDQGVVGALLGGLLLTGALWRTSMGSARHHPLAPALAGGLIGFLVVGLFDSLIDVPRLAWLFYLLVLVALTLPVKRPGQVISDTAQHASSH